MEQKNTQALTLAQYLEKPHIKSRLEEVFGQNAAAIKSTLVNICATNPSLQRCTPKSIVGAAALIVSSNLSLLPGMGQAYIVPYKNKEIFEATFQIGFKGLIQLAHRTGQYTRLHAGKVFEGEFKGFHPLTGEPILGERVSDKVVGYVAYMQLVNGFEKTLFMTTAEIEAHARKYSTSYSYDKRSGRQTSQWSTNFDAMATKTVLKKLLNLWGILSVEMSRVMQADQSVVDKTTFTYVDNGGNVSRREDFANVEETFDVTPEPRYTLDMKTGEIVRE